MNSVLVGNGINIQFGGNEYTSANIMKRIKQNALNGEYNVLMGNQVDGRVIVNILESFVQIANDIIGNRYDNVLNQKCEENNILKMALECFKQRYSRKIKDPSEIMLEDWLLLVKVFFLTNWDLKKQEDAVVLGFKEMILDSIYNNGKIQKNYLKMNENVRIFFCSFDNIFTLNYDNNLEKLTQKQVYHLHGDFLTLEDRVNLSYVRGFYNAKIGMIEIISGKEHCYCNALLEYSGKNKYEKINMYHKMNVCISHQIENSKDNLYKYAELLKKSERSEYRNLGEFVSIKLEHPNLQFLPEYCFYEFENIEDELSIIGLSPNNDEHIFETIRNNKKVKKVKFYYYSIEEKNYVEENFSSNLFECADIRMLWDKLK